MLKIATLSRIRRPPCPFLLFCRLLVPIQASFWNTVVTDRNFVPISLAIIFAASAHSSSEGLLKRLPYATFLLAYKFGFRSHNGCRRGTFSSVESPLPCCNPSFQFPFATSWFPHFCLFNYSKSFGNTEERDREASKT